MINKDNILQVLPRILFIIFVLALALRASHISTEYELLEQQKKYETGRKMYLTGKFDPDLYEGFVQIAPEHTFGEEKMFLLRETYDAFILMHEAAKKDGVDLKIASAVRNFEDQKNIWNEQWALVPEIDEVKLEQNIPDGLRKFREILRFRSAPGTSRHHFGTDFDINRINPLFANSSHDKEIREAIYTWLVKNASRFDFCQTYTPKDAMRETGYGEERWHWSYTPLSKIFTEEYRSLVKPEDISGFQGDEYVKSEDLINKYVLSINPECL